MRLIHIILIGFALGLAAVLIGMFANKPEEAPLGATTEPTEATRFLGGLYGKFFSWGGGIATLTDATGGAYTLTQAELANASVLKFAAGGAGQEVIALTLPATSTMTTLIKSAGDCKTWLYDASALAAATTTTVTAGTGHDVIAVTTNDDVIDGTEFAEITMCRQADGDVTTITSELLNAD